MILPIYVISLYCNIKHLFEENICINLDLWMTNASILIILVEVHYYAPAKVTGWGHIVAAT